MEEDKGNEEVKKMGNEKMKKGIKEEENREERMMSWRRNGVRWRRIRETRR